MRHIAFPTLVLIVSASVLTAAEGWPRFRGPDGNGISKLASLPLRWGDTDNLKWKTPLPGAGSSSPIVWGDRIFVTCYAGYGTEEGQSLGDLKRSLVCLSRDGKLLWSKTIDATLPEDDYRGYITEHGYASNTPVTDGQRVYAFFGKSGVFAFDFDGQQLWHVQVGQESSNRKWGSAASLVLFKDLLIVNAAEESQWIRALDQRTGDEVWKAEASSFELAYGTPAILPALNELAIAVPGELWGLSLDTGKLKWYAETKLTGNVCPTPIVDGDTIYVFGGYQSTGSHAIRAGGTEDVTDSHTVWSTNHSSYVATPLLHDGHLYWVDDRGQAFCLQAATGKLVYRERLRGLSSGGKPVYASPVLAGDKLYVVSRWDGTLVFPAKAEFEQLSQNTFAEDDSDFNATPAVSGNDLFLRSNRFLYCIGR